MISEELKFSDSQLDARSISSRKKVVYDDKNANSVECSVITQRLKLSHKLTNSSCMSAFFFRLSPLSVLLAGENYKSKSRRTALIHYDTKVRVQNLILCVDVRVCTRGRVAMFLVGLVPEGYPWNGVFLWTYYEGFS